MMPPGRRRAARRGPGDAHAPGARADEHKTTGCSDSSTSSTRRPRGACRGATSAPSLLRVLRLQSSARGASPATWPRRSRSASSEALPVWARARAESDWAAFARTSSARPPAAPARRVPPGQHPYDALLESYEPGMTTAVLRDLFGRLQSGLGEIIDAAARSRRGSSRGPSPCASSASSGSRWPPRWASTTALTPGRRGASLRAVDRADRHPGHGPLRPGRPQRALRRAPRGRPRPHERQSDPDLARTGLGRGSPSGSTSPRAGSVRTSSGAATPSGCGGCRARRTCSRRPRPHAGRVPARGQRGAPVAHPHRGRRDDLPAARRPALRARGGVHRGRPRGGRRAGGLGRRDARPARRRGARRPARRAAGHPLGLRRAPLLPDLRAGHDRGRAAVAGGGRADPPPRRVAGGGRARAVAGLAGRARPPPRPAAGARRAARRATGSSYDPTRCRRTCARGSPGSDGVPPDAPREGRGLVGCASMSLASRARRGARRRAGAPPAPGRRDRRRVSRRRRRPRRARRDHPRRGARGHRAPRLRGLPARAHARELHARRAHGRRLHRARPVSTKDHQLVARHEPEISQTTNVADHRSSPRGGRRRSSTGSR